MHGNATRVHSSTEVLTQDARADVLLCDYCSDFVAVSYYASLYCIGVLILVASQKLGKKKHPLQSIVDHVMTGEPGLNKAQIARWIDSPLLANNARVQAIRNLDPSFGPSSVCFVRWLFEGAPHVFSDFELGRNIRRSTSDGAMRIWEELPSACRKCCHKDSAVFSGTYTEAILFGTAEAMKKEFETVIECTPVVPGITFFCTKCRSVSAISFEYDRALRAALLLPQQFDTACGYYVSIAANHRAKKNNEHASLLKKK
jgi:hypothetical protein